MKQERYFSFAVISAATGVGLMLAGCGDPDGSAQGPDPRASAGSTSIAGSPGKSGSGGSGGSTSEGQGGASTAGAASGGSAGKGNEGSAGSAGTASAGTGGGGNGPSSCLPAFKAACSPKIDFRNEEADGDAKIFDQVIPDPTATMQDVVCTVCSILFRDPDEIPEDNRHTTIKLWIHDYSGVAQAGGNQIEFSSRHIRNYADDPEAALVEFRGVLVHETTHLYQHYGNGGLGEGMADFVRIRVGLYERGRRRTGGAWTDPYTTSGFFFSWLAGPCDYHKDGRNPNDPDIGYLINKRIGEQGASGVPKLFEERFGKDVKTLWSEYQAAIK